jgi:Domain of unknown function (DUF4331)
MMKSITKRSFALAGTALTLTAGLIGIRIARGSDHADTPQIAASAGTDLTDVFIFPSPADSNKVVLAMCVSPLIPTGGTRAFDPTVLYQFKIDNNGDNNEDLVIQARFEGSGASQKVMIAGPVAPTLVGTTSELATPFATTGTLNTEFNPTADMKVFAGVREDPFFFDLEQFFTILPDRAYPINNIAVLLADANTPKATTWRTAGSAKDFLAGFNVLALVVELPKSALKGAGSGKIGVWCTTSK